MLPVAILDRNSSHAEHPREPKQQRNIQDIVLSFGCALSYRRDVQLHNSQRLNRSGKGAL